MTVPYGVYIGKDIEVVSAGQFVIVYRRYPDNQKLEALLFNRELECVGICRTMPGGIKQIVLDLLDKDISSVVKQQDDTLTIIFEDKSESTIVWSDIENDLLNGKIKRFSLRDNSTVVHYADGSERRFPASEGADFKYALLANDFANDGEMKDLLGKQMLTIDVDGNKALQIMFNDNVSYAAEMHESFTMEDLMPPCPLPGEAGVGKCLQLWSVGYTEMTSEDRFDGLQVNTGKHMYIFQITQDLVYCRAARYMTCDKGVVFDQNFRQQIYLQSSDTSMIEDNRKAMDELNYDESLFNPDVCAWNNNSVYWSVSSVSDTLIKLHGCSGATYEWWKPR
ncbi:MAG: hypothetical protein LBH44_09045 [Treponema sp.]|jgi:hypothetical protein|nr:hypothetical protein [Treponema sp.]